MPKPIKRHLDGFVDIEHRIERVISEAFDLPFPYPPDIKAADLLALATEKRDLMDNPIHSEWEILPDPHFGIIQPMLPRTAEGAFMARFLELTGLIK